MSVKLNKTENTPQNISFSVDENIKLVIARNLRSMRISKGYSQMEIGDVLGITFQQVQKYEKALNRISAEDLYRLACFYNEPISYFFGNVNNNEVHEFGSEALQIVRQYKKIKDTSLKSNIMKFIKSLNNAGY